jgi:Protein of unknown function (DUF3429)
MPVIAVLLGIAGLVPVIGCGLGAMGRSGDSERMLSALIAYGAVMLAFLGGMQWGFALPAGAEPRRQRWRLVLGVLPALIGWLALLIALVTPGWIALAVLTAGFIGTALAEQRSAAQDSTMLPSGYHLLRWGLTVVVAAMLITVLTVRVLGVTIAF